MTTTGEAQLTPSPPPSRSRSRHQALARLGRPVLSVQDMKQIIAERKARGGLLPMHDRWAKS